MMDESGGPPVEQPATLKLNALGSRQPVVDGEGGLGGSREPRRYCWEPSEEARVPTDWGEMGMRQPRDWSRSRSCVRSEASSWRSMSCGHKLGVKMPSREEPLEMMEAMKLASHSWSSTISCLEVSRRCPVSGCAVGKKMSLPERCSRFRLAKSSFCGLTAIWKTEKWDTMGKKFSKLMMGQKEILICRWEICARMIWSQMVKAGACETTRSCSCFLTSRSEEH